MLRIEDYYTDAPSAGIITMLEKPEVVNRLLNTLICNFRGFDFMKLKINMHPVREELEEQPFFGFSYAMEEQPGNSFLSSVNTDISYTSTGIP